MEISAAELKHQIEAGKVTLIDCREPAEHAIAAIAGARLIPMNTIPANLPVIEALADDKTVVIYCHHGVRSLNVVNWLRHHGVENVQSLSGGIDEWSVLVDSSVPRY